jgi:uncharacterized lipoprotein YmbA
MLIDFDALYKLDTELAELSRALKEGKHQDTELFRLQFEVHKSKRKQMVECLETAIKQLTDENFQF